MKSAYEYNIELMQKCSPALAYDGGDFDKWRKAAREKLSSLIGLDKFEKVPAELQIEYEAKADFYTELRFSFNTEKGFRSVAHILIPDGITKPPVMICLQGHSTGMHISLGRAKFAHDEETISGGDRDFAIRAVKEGFAAVALEQRSFGELGGSEKGPRCLESALTALLTGRTTVGERVWDVMRLIDLLEESFSDRLDIDTICCMGNSGGGTTTVYSAALEDRIKLAMPSCAMCTYKASIGAMPHCACNFVPYIASFFDMGDLMAMAYPKYFVQVSGKNDNIFPLSGATEVFNMGKSAYERLGAKDRCVLVEGDGGHRFYADDAWPHVHGFIKK